jgi:hypothetical membrane protein
MNMPIFKSKNIHTWLALAGIAGPVLLVIGELVAALSDPQFSMVRDSISSLALTPLGWVQTIGFLAIGLLVEIFVAGLLFNIRGVRGFGFGIGSLVFVGFGLLLIGAFRTDPAGAPDTVEGNIHSLTALTVFWLFPIAILLIAPSLKHDPNWRSLFVYTVVTGILAVALVIGLLCLRDRITWFGLYERILVANMVIWFGVTAIKLLCLARGWGLKTQPGG